MMLTIPEVLTQDGVVVFPDDQDPDLFYLLPTRPRLRIDDSDRPVFRALFWTDQAAGERDAVAGLRGGKLNFDVDLAIPDRVKERIAEVIRTSGVRERTRHRIEIAERERLRRLARARGEPEDSVDVDLPPTGAVRFGSIRFVGGMVTLLEEKDGGLVEWSSAGGPPSLMGDNNAAFSLRLGPEGAAVWYRALEEDAGALSLRYELTFEARLPSLEIHVWAASHQDYDLERKVERTKENVDKGCSDADVEHIDVREVTETLVEDSLIHIEIDKGTSKISDEHVAQLRSLAIDLVSEKVKEVVANRIHGLTEEERRASLIGLIEEEITSFAELRFRQRDVVEWPVNPQATITDFMGGLSGDDRRGLVRLVDLADPVVSTLEVDVSAAADWDADPAITQVTVYVRYDRDPDEPVKTVVFRKGDGPQTLRWRHRGGSGEVTWWARAYVQGFEEPIAMDGERTNGAVHVQVPRLGAFTLKMRPHPDLFSLRGAGKITAVSVDYAYGAAGAADHIENSLTLAPADVEGKEVTHTTGKRLDAPLIVQPTYYREDRPAIVGSEQRVWVRPGDPARIEVPVPWKDSLRVRATVPANIDGLRSVEVELQHRDHDAGFESDANIFLGGEGAEAEDWTAMTTLVQLDKQKQRYRYRYKVIGAEQLAYSAWAEAEGDGELLLPVLGVSIRGSRLGLGERWAAAVLELDYRDPGHDMRFHHEIALEPGQDQAVWLVPRLDPTVDGYGWRMTLIPLDAGEPTLVEGTGAGRYLFLQPPE